MFVVLQSQVEEKLDFYVSLENFHGDKLTAPILEGKAVDLHQLYLLTSQLGKFRPNHNFAYYSKF